MTLEKLLGSSADELDKFSQAEREAFFKPFLTTTRPSSDSKPHAAVAKAVVNGKAKKAAALDKLQQLFLEKTGQKLILK